MPWVGSATAAGGCDRKCHWRLPSHRVVAVRAVAVPMWAVRAAWAVRALARVSRGARAARAVPRVARAGEREAVAVVAGAAAEAACCRCRADQSGCK